MLALWLVLAMRHATLAEPDVAAVRGVLRMLHGVEHEYAEALDENGRIVRPVEIEEAGLLLDGVKAASGTLVGSIPDLHASVAALAADIAGNAPAARVAAQCRDLREVIVKATGVTEEIAPPAPPSATRGAQLYAANCSSCHGVNGAGDGPDATKLTHPPPDFTDPTFMEGETPADFFLVISLGRQTRGMPAWESSLSVQERWDLVSYLWFLGEKPGDEERRIAIALARVHDRVAEAVSAYRLRESGASTIALDAYLTFEPIEARLAATQPAVIRRVESDFVRLQQVLRQPDSLREVEAAAQAVAASLNEILQPRSGPRNSVSLPAVLGVAGLCALLAVIVRVRR